MPSRLTSIGLLLALLVAVPSPAQVSAPYKTGYDRNGGDLVVGDFIDWTIGVSNPGSSDIIDVVVTDPLEPTLDFELAGKGGIYDPSTHTVTWDASTTPELAIIPPFHTVLLSLTTIVNGPAPEHCNQASITDSTATVILTDDIFTPAVEDPTCLDGTTSGNRPEVTAIEPCRGTKKGGSEITILGSGFELGAVVFLDDVEATVTAVQPTEIQATTGTHPAVGSVDAVVRNPGGAEGTLADGWVYTPVPFPILLHSKKSSGTIHLVWTDIGRGKDVVVRSTDPLFGCSVTITTFTDTSELTDDDLEDGELYFYRVE